MTNNRSKLKVSKNTETALPDKDSTGTFSRWIENENQRLRFMIYPPKYRADHTCYDGHAFYVVEGKINIELGEEMTEWRKGDVFIIPDKVPHRVINIYKETAQMVVVD
ncbi:MAG TPA: cupin domain-containing protein [Pseudogracilibacillus sp.]|nr:cupin domain-containing protein [Pseudogracilibacillus sp.]